MLTETRMMRCLYSCENFYVSVMPFLVPFSMMSTLILYYASGNNTTEYVGYSPLYIIYKLLEVLIAKSPASLLVLILHTFMKAISLKEIVNHDHIII